MTRANWRPIRDSNPQLTHRQCAFLPRGNISQNLCCYDRLSTNSVAVHSVDHYVQPYGLNLVLLVGLEPDIDWLKVSNPIPLDDKSIKIYAVFLVTGCLVSRFLFGWRPLFFGERSKGWCSLVASYGRCAIVFLSFVCVCTLSIHQFWNLSTYFCNLFGAGCRIRTRLKELRRLPHIQYTNPACMAGH